MTHGELTKPPLLVKGKQKYLYRAVDSQGNTLDLLTAKRDAIAALRLFRKTLKAIHTQTPRVVITVDKNPAYPRAIKELKAAKKLPEGIKLRQIKYLNNIANAKPPSHQTISQARYGIWVFPHCHPNYQWI